MEFISFYDSDGRITSSIGGDAEAIKLNKQHATAPWVDGDWSGQDVYVDSGRVHPRPENPAKCVGLTLTQLPYPGTIHIVEASAPDTGPATPGEPHPGETTYPYDEPTVELEFDHPGTYKVRVERWPYLDKEFEIENPPQ